MMRIVTAGMACSTVFVAAAAADDTGDVWAEMIDAAPSVVADGYRDRRYVYNRTVWRDVMRCTAPPMMAVDAERTCMVCSIDDVGGLKLRDGPAPMTAVSIRLAYAHFERDDAFAWALREYEVIGGNYRATNGEYRHRASVRWIKEPALKECEDMHELVGTMRF